MGKSYVFRDEPFSQVEGRRRVLVTGAAGRIGSYFAEKAHETYELKLMVRGDEERMNLIEPFGEVVQCDLGDLEGLNRACEGIDTVLHLAADPRVYATWDSLLPNNIVGIYHVFAAAKSQGCRRVVYASSVNAMNASPSTFQVRSEDPVNPGNLYGVSKCFGEALCRFYAIREGLSGIAIRIGGVEDLQAMKRPNHPISASVYVSPRDIHQLIVRCIDDLRLQFAIFQGLSNNRYCQFDTSDARELVGYRPVDDAFNIPSE